MESAAPPLVGFNNNVRYRGMRFHIQTEDSGVTRPHIITHLFADGGHIIKSIRTDYSEYVDRPDRPTVIQRLMREQHRAMALDLRDGRLDATIDGLIRSSTPPAETSIPEEADPGATAEPAPSSKEAAPALEHALSPPAEALPSNAKEASPSGKGGREAKSSRRSVKPAEKTAERARRSVAPPKAKRSQPPARRAGRPSAALPMEPGGESIFGTAPQESLDEVILSYVTHAKNGPPSRGSK